VPVAAELRNDLLIQPALVVIGDQKQVGALFGGELNNAGEVWGATPSLREAFDFGEGCAYSLDQHTLQFKGCEQGLE